MTRIYIAVARIVRRLSRIGLYVTRVTSRKDLLSFLQTVRPVDTGWGLIRMGGNSDGGYLLPNDLVGIDACFSPGVAGIASFEESFAHRGVQCFLADYSISELPVQHKLFEFSKRNLGIYNDDSTMTLEQWVTTKAPQGENLVLQMDIEGAEFGVLCDAPQSVLERFRILVVEFHFLDGLLNWWGYQLVGLTFQKLLRSFEIVHIHPNNCSQLFESRGVSIPPVMEVTFHRKDRVLSRQRIERFPHPLDCPNVKEEPEIVLPTCWYRSPEDSD